MRKIKQSKIVGIISKPVLDIKRELLWQNLYIQQDIANILNNYNITCIGIIPQGIDIDRVNSDDINIDKEKELTDTQKQHIIKQLELCNGLILQGGLSSHKYEIFIAQYAIENNIPIIGICAGFNNILRAIGVDVTYNEDIAIIHDKYSRKEQHNIYTEQSQFKVNSMHTMSIEEQLIKYDNRINIEAITIDNINNHKITTVEAFSINNTKFAVGIKWHPELMPNSKITKELFDKFTDTI